MPTEERKNECKNYQSNTRLTRKPRASQNEKTESWMWMQHLNVVNFTHNHSRFVHNFRFPAIKSLQTTSHTFTNHQPNYKLNSILQTLHEHFMTTFLNYRKKLHFVCIQHNTQPSQRRPIVLQDFRCNNRRIATLVMFCLQFHFSSFVSFIIRVDCEENLFQKKQCIVHCNSFYKLFHHMFPVPILLSALRLIYISWNN